MFLLAVILIASGFRTIRAGRAGIWQRLASAIVLADRPSHVHMASLGVAVNASGMAVTHTVPLLGEERKYQAPGAYASATGRAAPPGRCRVAIPFQGKELAHLSASPFSRPSYPFASAVRPSCPNLPLFPRNDHLQLRYICPMHYRTSTTTILLVDWDAVTRRAVENALMVRGISVFAVANTHSAIEILDNVRDGIDHLLTDVISPNGDPHGPVLAEMAKKRAPKLHVIYMTCNGDLIRAAAQSRGPLLHKPIDVDLLMAEIFRRTMA
jgi:CheY-like chemotaxis protein